MDHVTLKKSYEWNIDMNETNIIFMCNRKSDCNYYVINNIPYRYNKNNTKKNMFTYVDNSNNVIDCFEVNFLRVFDVACLKTI